MKIPFTLSALMLAALSTSQSHAARGQVQQATLEGTAFTGLTIAGAVAAGPVGFIVGALGGAFLADQSRQANNAKLALLQADVEQQQLQTALDEQKMRLQAVGAEVVSKLSFQILFATGSDTLNELDLQRLSALAEHLERNPDLVVLLDGHADPRGTDEYNNVLSQERAKAVKEALETFGISAGRIRYQGHGNRFTSAPKGDEDAYRQERRVDITLEPASPVYAHF